MGEILQNARKGKKLVQGDLEDRGLSLGTISRIENGGCRVGKDTLIKMCDKLNINLDQLINHSNKKSSTTSFDMNLKLKAIENDMDLVDFEVG